jgi:putative radical SAM enzyme (TIGR03279 family)
VAVTICGVEQGSPAAKAKICAGEQLVSINGQEIADVLDYRFYMMEMKLKLEILSASGEKRTVSVRKEEYEELGLLFDSYLMDKERSCRNQCIFCFIDQMPPGMRETLYFKDDDARLSFLYGNYITLTNLSEHDIERTIRMKISPVNISVHTTNPELRCKMMHNRFAGDSLSIMRRLADGGIAMNAQLVLCPGINDGAELERSLTDLAEYLPALQTVSCVPVGLTKYRDGLTPLRPYTKEEAAAVIDLVNCHGDKMLAEHGQRVFYASDEFYLKAERPLPDGDFYGDYGQLENGVGMLTLQREQFREAIPFFEPDNRRRKISIATGVAAAPFIQKLVDEAAKTWHNLDVRVFPIVNDFFGHNITVAGLITGQDLIAQLKGQDLGEELLLPDVLLKFHEDVLLDDVTLDQVREELGVPITMVNSDGYELLRCILGEEE